VTDLKKYFFLSGDESIFPKTPAAQISVIAQKVELPICFLGGGG